MFIVFLDINQRTIKAYGPSGVEEFFFDELGDFRQYAGAAPFMYITNACNATVDQLEQLVQPYIDADAGDDYSLEGEEDIKFLKSNVNGTLIIEDAGIKYTNSGECKEIDAEMVEIMKSSVSIRTLLREGKLSIVDYKTMVKAKRKSMRAMRQNNKLMEASRAAKDSALDDIIIDRSESGTAEAMAASGGIFNEADEQDDITDDILKEDQELKSMSQEEMEEAIREGRFAT